MLFYLVFANVAEIVIKWEYGSKVHVQFDVLGTEEEKKRVNK